MSKIYRSLLEDALVTIQDLRAKLEAKEHSTSKQPTSEAIAIIGMGCRFPGGANTPEKFWDLLHNGVDVLREIPASRWDVETLYDPNPEAMGKIYVRQGYFLDDIDQFDSQFFNIPPLEASSLDPQQRLLLEVTWEALEKAGVAADKLRLSQTGIFIGSFWDDYSAARLYQVDHQEIDAYRGLSSLRGMMAGRLAYILGLQGPTIQVDTACSSSLVAVHLACQSLLNQESELALAGGVDLMVSAERTLSLCRMRAVSPDGRSKTFSANADGFGQGEGCGMVVLKRLSDAQRDGDPILAVIRASGANHDGPSNGLTAPNGLAQEKLLRQVLQRANLQQELIDFVETHGTGTELGDPIEVISLAKLFSQNRSNPLFLGSVKTNVGHLSGAAGIASLIKVILALQHGLIPPNLHFDEPNPHIPWSEIPFTVPTELTPWPAPNGQPRLAGISSFGLTGTNVHVVVAEAPAPVEVVSEPTRPHHLLTLSGKTEQALADQVVQYQRYLKQHGGLNLGDVCYTSTVGRVHFEQRLGVVATDMAELQQKLAVYQSGELPLGMAQGVGQAEKPKVAFLFPGQGPQYAAMGRELYETQPVFREIMDDCDQILQSYWDKSLLEILYGADEASNDQLLDEATYAQPALFAIEYALAKLWQSWGIEPEVVIGHSMGEYAAACFAGVFSLADGLKLIAERGRLMQEEAEAGQMVAVLASAEEVAPVIEPFAAEVSIGVINTPQNLVISGRPSGVKKAVETLEAAGIETRQLKIYVASHSPLMDKILDPFEAVVESVTKHPPQIKVVSNLTGTVVAEELTTPGYWRQHLRNSVQFAQGMATLAGLGIDTFIEVGPKPTLLGMGQQCLPEAQAVWLPSLYPKQQGDWAQLLSSVGQFHVQGGRVDWAAVHQPYGYQKLSLPTYPFQRKRYWLDKPKAGRQTGRAGHPLVGDIRQSPTSGEISFATELSADYPAYLKDHQVFERVVVPAAAYLEMVVSASQQLADGPYQVENILFQQPLILSEQGETQMQLVFSPHGMGYQWQLFSQSEAKAPWQLHVQGDLRLATSLNSSDVTLTGLQAQITEEITVDNGSPADGLYFGPDFQGLRQLFRGEGEALGLIQLPDNLSAADYQIHPVLLDSCLRVAQGIETEENDQPYLPFSCEQVTFHGSTPLTTVWSHVEWQGETGGTQMVDITLYDAETGQLVTELRGFGVRQANREAVTGSALRTDWLYQLNWEPATELPQFSPYETAPGSWLVVGDTGSAMVESLVTLLEEEGAEVIQGELSALDENIQGVIYLAIGSVEEAQTVEQAFTLATEVLALAQTLLKSESLPDLWLVTAEKVEQAVLWGLARTLHWEYPQLNSRCVAMQAETTGETLFETIWYADKENQISLPGMERQVARLERLSLTRLEEVPYPFQVQLGQYGLLDQLALVPASRQTPQTNQVEVQVRAVGLNFKDVLHALGMLKDYYPAEMGLEDPLNQPFGFEGAGVITKIGAAVTEFKVGDEVIIWAAEQVMASYITVDVEAVSLKPKHLSFSEAATVPITYLTAYYGLIELAQMKAGDKVLIHAAAGGVGQAAIQLAKHVEAEVFATASPPKWEFLQAQGIQHVMNSRTLDYAEEIKGLTNGEGVDVVLNSLNGEYIAKNFDVLAENGRFIEIGKIDIWDEAQAQAYRPDVEYFAFDLGEAAAATPGLMTDLQSKVGDLFAKQQVAPLSHHTFPIERVSDAFQYMAQAKHIGKVVLTVAEEPPGQEKNIHPEVSYLITGGVGGLGLKVAEWLVTQGATHLVLSSRRGAASETAQAAIAELEAQGATVQVVKADVSTEGDVIDLLAESQAQVPLAGIIHAAGVLDDGILLEQTAERFATVFAPKVAGSWYLHQHSLELPLDFFVCFSSQASLLGNGGQANYAAANAFMDSLMAQRRVMGLPGLSINWGAWAEVGLASELAAQSGEGISPEQGVELLGALLSQDVVQAGVLPINWRRFGQQLPSVEPFPMLSKLLTGQGGSQKSSLQQQLSRLSAEEGYNLLKQHVKEEIAFIVGSTPTDEQGFFDLGMDSLMSIQLANRLSAALQINLPTTVTLEYGSVEKLTQYLAELVLGSQKAIVPTSQPRRPASVDDDAIAIIGMGCRFPGGANNLTQYWELLHQGQDAIVEIPVSRWKAEDYYDPTVGAAGKSYVKSAGFLEHPIEEFDPQFFGMAPLEAQHLDAQQRLLLEVTWEALENSGVPVTELPLDTGIFVGLISDNHTGERETDVYSSGNIMSMATGRLAHWLGVHGPNMAIDTACSSSLVALHLACHSLRTGESDLALSGGAQLLLSPDGFVKMSAVQALSPDGRSKSFSAQADGYGRGEGCGMVVLKRLADAVADGDRIWGVIRGSAVNHDGPSTGLTVPNKVAQTRLIKQALANAQVSGEQISYVESHGTGTKLGDPIEVRALAEALGERAEPLHLGAVKSNIGHLEASAGIAGVIKTVLAMHHQTIPPNLHFEEPSPHIEWDKLPFAVPTEPTPWTVDNGATRLAGVSSFGLSGTNAHIILAEAPVQPEPEVTTVRPQHLLTLSGKTEQALADQVAQYQRYLKQHADLNIGDVSYTSNVGRVHFEQRLGVVAAEMAELHQKLAAYQSGELPLGMVQGVTQTEQPKVAFLFTGQGAQYAAMGRELYETQPLFREIMTECDQILRSYIEISLLDLLYGEDQAKSEQLLTETRYTQPALFAVEYALAKLWQSWGVEPIAVIGHSVGEYVAACLAEVLSLGEGLKLVAARGRLMQALPQNGLMVAVQAEEAEMVKLLAPYQEQVSIAGLNAPQSVVLSGKAEIIEQLVEQLEGEGVKCNLLKVSHAFHSPLMAPMLAEFGEVARGVTYASPKLKLISNVTGQLLTEITADYWVAHVRQAVRFADGMGTLAAIGIDTFIEVGPKSTLLGMGQQCLPEAQAVWLPSLYPKQQGDWAQLLSSVGQFHVQGGRVDWAAVHQPYAYHKVSLPTYPFQRKRYWLDKPKAGRRSGGGGHPLLGEKLVVATSEEIVFANELSADYPAYLKDHQVYERVVVPAAAYLEMVVSASQQLADGPYQVENVVFQQPLILSEQGETQVQLVFSPHGMGYQWQLFSQSEAKAPWHLHAQGDLTLAMPLVSSDVTLTKLQGQITEEITVNNGNVADVLYFGPDFQGLRQLFRGEGEALGLIQLPDNLSAADYQIHPVLLDSCLRVVQGIETEENDQPYLPFSCEQVTFHGSTPLTTVWSHVEWQGESAGTRQLEFTIYDAETGQLVAELRGFGFRQSNREAVTGSALRTDWLYQLNWEPATELPQFSPYETAPGSWLVVGDVGSAMVESLVTLLEEEGAEVIQGELSALADVIESEALTGVIYLALGTAEESQIPAAALTTATAVVGLAQTLVKAESNPDVWLVTAEKVEQGVLWGLARTLHWEYPQLNSRCVAMQAETTGETLFETIWYADKENQISLPGGERQVARLERYQPKIGNELSLNPEGSYLITGGVGGLGLKVAEWLVAQGASHLVLSSRRGAASETAQATIAELEAQGATVQVIKADVSTEGDVIDLLAESQAQVPLAGIIHAAGVLDDGILLEQTAERFATVFAPKVAGSWYLHQHSLELPLDFFVCFSSQASLLGNGGQANYAAANAFMDGLMHERRALGLPGLSINWGAWAEVGLASELAAQSGEGISPEQGVALLGALLSQDVVQAGVLPINWRRFGQQLPSVEPFPMLSKLLTGQGGSQKSSLQQQLSRLSAEEGYNLLKQHVEEEIAFIVGSTPTGEQGFFDLGMDSLMSIQLANRLSAALQINLPTTVTLEYGSVEKLTQYLAELVLEIKVAPVDTEKKRKSTLEEEVGLVAEDDIDSLIEQELDYLDSLL